MRYPSAAGRGWGLSLIVALANLVLPDLVLSDFVLPDLVDLSDRGAVISSGYFPSSMRLVMGA
jgi:hypothetical protein